jgi:hypothetical protein
MATETVNVDLGNVQGLRALRPVTNAEDFILVINVFNGGTAYDLDGEAATMSIRDRWGDELLTATGTLSDDADAVTSVVTFTFREASMAMLNAGAYTVAARLIESPATRQLLLAKLPVRDGSFG